MSSLVETEPPQRKDPALRAYIHSPLIFSRPLSAVVGTPVYLKLEMLQPSGSYKDRGMWKLCSTLKANGAKKLISSSGGNAGHSCAHVGRLLGMTVHVVVPITTQPIMLERIKEQGAEVEIFGENWNAADERARQIVAEDPEAEYISPYDNPLLWEGASTIIDELAIDGVRPGAIVLSVGGGGMMMGTFLGLKRHGWDDVQVIGAETDGAASFAAAMKAGGRARLSKITSIATSLGALEVTPAVIEAAKLQPTTSVVVSDKEAIEACCNFLTDHRLLVEPACGASLAVAYSQARNELLKEIDPVVIVVCGGGGVTDELIHKWKNKYLW